MVTETYSGASIPPGDSIKYSFATLLFDSVDTNGVLCTWTSKGGDFDLSNDTTCINVSIDVNSGIASIDNKRGHLAYPNPATDHLNIEFDNTAFNSFDLFVHDLLGKTWIEVKDIRTNNYFIKAGTLPSGIYLYSLKGKENPFNGRLFVN